VGPPSRVRIARDERAGFPEDAPLVTAPPRGSILMVVAAGFIGSYVAGRLLSDDCHVVGFDSLSHYYDPILQQALDAASRVRFERRT
jgi:hypothetical protein